ncbi:MAG: peptidoglycan DD-metalloendopeptidase family protein [Nautiliaceae bacterium]
MKKLLLITIFLFSSLFAYKIDITTWGNKDTFYGFLKKNSLPLKIYYNLPAKIKKMVRRIPVGSTVFILKNNNEIKQALIPLNSKEQLQILKKNNKYISKIVPIVYETQKKYAEVEINNYLSYDLYKATHLRSLTSKLINIFEDRVNFRAIPKNTKIRILYEEKLRFGKVKDVKIIFAEIKNRYFDYTAFYNPEDGRYYDREAKSLKGMFLKAPLKYTRISSKFGMRFHPILHKWRMHDGIDYVNRPGTPIHTVADGKVIFKGWMGGYGKAVKIKHKNGYVTLYAHLKGWPRGLYVGKWVKQGQTIGYLGNTGLSTGPHLHFGVMRYGRWINPAKLKNSVKIALKGKQKEKFLAYVNSLIKENNIALK